MKLNKKLRFLLVVLLLSLFGCKAETYLLPTNVTSFAASAKDGKVELTWGNPDYPNLHGVKVVRKTLASPQSPTDGDQVYFDSGVAYTDTLVTNGTTYYYRAFTYDFDQNYSPGAGASATPAAVAPLPVSNVKATASAGVVSLTWTNPSPTPGEPNDFAGVKILRQEATCPADQNQGVSVYLGSNSQTSDSTATSGKLTCYSLFAYGAAGAYASAVNVTVTP